PLATAVGGKAWHVVRPWHGSAAEQAAAILETGVRMTAGFHTISADALRAIDVPMDSDVMICGDDAEAKALALDLASRLVSGRAVDCGPLASARALEGMTAVIVNVNKRYKAHAGLRVTGLP
ncbi:MAG TPA: hypothetical protein VLS46_00795, partial [Gaiellaceae bacterium]|nr:hypothetical protein [Gaiellaceae bacterium]